jgi:protoporphyrinogen oxidase
MPTDHQIVIIGAGPAGLTAAYQLTRFGVEGNVVLESDDVVGGISRTVERDGWRFDIGGHRFFTKVPEVEAVWHEILPEDEFLVRPRLSRIYYGGKFYDYPLRAWNALRNLGPVEATRCVASYLWARVHPPKDTSTFEGWTVSRFGWRLYRTFFKTYTEKVWGVGADEIQADWAAQRIKNLSLGKAIVNALSPRRNQRAITSLIEEFEYPRLGPGMMWETCCDIVTRNGTDVLMGQRVVAVELDEGAAVAVVAEDDQGIRRRYPCTAIVSSMPLGALVDVMDPPAPDAVLAAGRALRHRDFLTVALVIPERHAFPDNWIYVHETGVKLGRIQNFASWSPDMVKPGRTCLGLEYFVNEGDDWWSRTDADLVRAATAELERIRLVPSGVVEAGYVVRMPKAYPLYDAAYAGNVAVVQEWLAGHAVNVWPVGRNGMHRYNNQDHSMYTAMLAVENIVKGAAHDIWSVNVEPDYHEEKATPATPPAAPPAGTGRGAPVIATIPASGSDCPGIRDNR